MGDINERIEKLEREVRRMRSLNLFLIACLLVVGLGAARFAGEFVLQDDQGRDAIIMGPNLTSGSTRSIIIRDLNGRNRIALGINNDNKTYINAFDKDGVRVKTLGEVP